MNDFTANSNKWLENLGGFPLNYISDNMAIDVSIKIWLVDNNYVIFPLFSVSLV